MKQKFPKYNKSRKIAEKGVTLVKKIIEDRLEWIFRSVSLDHDFGIDGYIDIVNDSDYVTGRTIAVQIKTGKSYFLSESTSSWKFKGENKHLNYYLNLDNPLLIILVDLEKQIAYWEEFALERTNQLTSGWTMDIPKFNILSENAKNRIYYLSGIEIDYSEQIINQWKINKQLGRSDSILLGIDKSEIENLDFTGIKSLLKTLTSKEEYLIKSCGKVNFGIFGYENDEREVYQIEEVRRYFQLSINVFKYWGYFLEINPETYRFTGISTLHLSCVDLKMVKFDEETNNFLVETDFEQTMGLAKQLFGWLNEFVDKYKIPEEVNRKRSELIMKALTGFNKEFT